MHYNSDSYINVQLLPNVDREDSSAQVKLFNNHHGQLL